MTGPSSLHAERRQTIWKHVHKELIKHAKPDSRFHFDFLCFTPDFRGSSAAIDRLVQLPSYKDASTILVTPDNSLEELRYRALKDGKKVLVGTYRLRRGFVILSPHRIGENDMHTASWLDGMEKPGIGRHLSLSQIQEEGIQIDLCVLGGLAFNTQGIVVWEGHGLFEVQWALLHDINAIKGKIPVVAVAHTCQVVDEVSMDLEPIKVEKAAEVQCDCIVTPERTFEVENAAKPALGIDFEAIDQDALDNIPPLQELKGMHMMRSIMKAGGMGQDDKSKEKTMTEDEQTGVKMMESIMKGFKF